MSDVETIQKIKQLLKSDDVNNSNVAIQLMKGQGISVEDVVNSINKSDIEIGMNGKCQYRYIPNICFAVYDITINDDKMIANAQMSYSIRLKMKYNKEYPGHYLNLI